MIQDFKACAPETARRPLSTLARGLPGNIFRLADGPRDLQLH